MSVASPSTGARRPARARSPRLPAWLLLATMLGPPLAAGCTGDSSGQPGPKATSRAVTVSVATVQARTVERTVDGTGSLLAWRQVVLNTAVPGTLTRLHVDLGDLVRAGQVVAELDQREFESAVEQAEAGSQAAADSLRRAQAQVEVARAGLRQVRDSRRTLEANLARAQAVLAEAKANTERTRRLLEEELVPRRELDVSRTESETARAQHEAAQVELVQYPDRVRSAEAQLASEQSAVRVAESELRRRQAEAALARKKLTDATLRAPLDGAVARRHVNLGEFVDANTPVFTIVQGDPLKWSGTVAEHAALELRPGQVVRLRVDSVPGRTFEGRVTRVSPAVDVTSRTALLEARVANGQGLLKPGLFARGAIALGEDRNVAFVPQVAVSYFAGITKVFVVADGIARERPVRLGARREDWVEVREGVTPGETVAASGLGQLQDGIAVTVATEPPRARPAAATPPPAGKTR